MRYRHIPLLREAGIPVVVLDRLMEKHRIDTVLTENVRSARSAVKYLLKKGHKRIAFIGVKSIMSSIQERFDGYVRAHRERRVPVVKALVSRSKLFEMPADAGYSLTKELLESGAAFTAIFAAHGGLEEGIFNALAEAGMQEKVEVVSFDVPSDRSLAGRLSGAVEQDPYHIGYYGARILLERIGRSVFKKPLTKPAPGIIVKRIPAQFIPAVKQTRK
jgi:LacI family transcriptional regulator